MAADALLGPQTLNERLLDDALRHHVRIQGYGEALAKKITQLLRDVEPELMDRLVARLRAIEARGYDRGPDVTARLRELLAGIGEIIDGRYSRAYQSMVVDLTDLAHVEAGREQVALSKAVGPLGLEATLPAPSTLAAIVTERPLEGRVLGAWTARLADNERAAVIRAIRQVGLGMAQGETIEQIVTRVQGPGGVMDISRRNARALVRTAVNHVSTAARLETFAQNESLISGERIVATLDGRTTPYCRRIDGEVFPVGVGPRPPFHWNCRSTVSPVVKKWSELGIPLREVPPGTRASMDGQVPAGMTYGAWFKRQPSSFQRRVLGPSRYKLFAVGKLDVNRFTDPSGRLFTLAELQAQDPALVDAAGITIPKRTGR